MLDRFFIAVVGLLLLQALVLAPSRFHERWLMPFAVVLPLWLFARMAPGRLTPGVRRRFGALLAIMAVAYCGARAVQVAFFADARRGPYPLRTDYRALAEEIRSAAGDQPSILVVEREVGGNLLLYLPKARVRQSTAALFRLPLPPGPVVVAWNPELTRGGLQPPWRLLRRDLSRTEVAGEEVRVVEVAPAAWGRPAPRIAWVLLPQHSAGVNPVD